MPRELVERLRESSRLTVLLAIRSVQTVAGALAIGRAEQQGRARPGVARAVERRVEQLRGTEGPGAGLVLITAADLIEMPRVVSATGRSIRRHF